MNHPITDAGRAVVQRIEEYVKAKITPKGIWPAPMFVLTSRGTELVEMNLPDNKILEVFSRGIQHSEVQAAIVGLDRAVDLNSREGRQSGQELEDVLVCTLFERAGALTDQVRTRDQFRFGIIEYKFRPRVIRDIKWENRFWINQGQNELYQFVPDTILGADGTLIMGPSMRKIVSPYVH